MVEKPYYVSRNGRVAIKLDILPGDQALVAGLSPERTKGVSVFEYPENHTTTIIGCQDREETIRLLRDALEELEEMVPSNANLHEPN